MNESCFCIYQLNFKSQETSIKKKYIKKSIKKKSNTGIFHIKPQILIYFSFRHLYIYVFTSDKLKILLYIGWTEGFSYDISHTYSVLTELESKIGDAVLRGII